MSERIICLDDIIPNEEYGKIRSLKRREMIELKKYRRLDIGPVASLYFESRDTMIYQIQEMAYVEKITRDALDEELISYNPLVPNGKELTATMMIEIDDPLRRKNFLSRLGGVEEKVKIIVEGSEIYADSEKDVDRTTGDGKASAVHFLHFKFSDELIEAFKDINNTVQIGIDHDAYGHLSIVSDQVREELAKEFI
ncbi:MAG: hypothetical protein CMJ12_01335 [Pelagibacterales bacterium]|nr:hypothetical protein [Pelagibacterales bacterium]PPR15995.1 MAG: hypothetical protein CFH33_01067 [Alphaproteobacteria bacterium MarineAlpha9_Bin3]|tara:strand:+ start:6839 stop:7426 length:588 start_codon:yes stop_codon:yes gene_type:complete